MTGQRASPAATRGWTRAARVLADGGLTGGALRRGAVVHGLHAARGAPGRLRAPLILLSVAHRGRRRGRDEECPPDGGPRGAPAPARTLAPDAAWAPGVLRAARWAAAPLRAVLTLLAKHVVRSCSLAGSHERLALHTDALRVVHRRRSPGRRSRAVAARWLIYRRARGAAAARRCGPGASRAVERSAGWAGLRGIAHADVRHAAYGDEAKKDRIPAGGATASGARLLAQRLSFPPRGETRRRAAKPRRRGWMLSARSSSSTSPNFEMEPRAP